MRIYKIILKVGEADQLRSREVETQNNFSNQRSTKHTEYITIPSNPACMRNASNQTRMLIMVLPNVRNECASSAARVSLLL